MVVLKSHEGTFPSSFHSFMFCIIGKTSQNLALPVLLNKNVSPSVVMIALKYNGVMQVS